MHPTDRYDDLEERIEVLELEMERAGYRLPSVGLPESDVEAERESIRLARLEKQLLLRSLGLKERAA